MKIWTFLLSVAFCQISLAQDIAGVKLTNRQSILNGKAFCLFPDSAHDVARSTDIMAAPPNPNEETRIIYDVGNMRIVFFAQELYLLGGNNLLQDVMHDSSYITNFNTRLFSQGNSLYTILSTPLKYDSLQAGILVGSLLVETADNTVFRLDAYIDSAAYPDRIQFQQLAENVFRTLTKGTRLFNLKERSESCVAGNSAKKITFYLPVNYCVTVDDGDDFKVFRFHKFRPFTDTAWADMLIYVGEHPSYMYMEYGLDETSAKKQPGKFLDKDVNWMIFKDDMHQLFLKEQVIPQNDKGTGTVIHVAMLSNRPEGLQELTKIAEAVQLSEK